MEKQISKKIRKETSMLLLERFWFHIFQKTVSYQNWKIGIPTNWLEKTYIIDFYRQPKNSFIFHYPKPFYKIRLNHIGLSPGCLSWKEEFRRLYFLAPWNGINAENNAAEAQGSMKWFSDYAGKNEQYDPRCPETISNAHYGKVLQFTLNFNLTCRSSFTLMIVFLKNLCC